MVNDSNTTTWRMVESNHRGYTYDAKTGFAIIRFCIVEVYALQSVHHTRTQVAVYNNIMFIMFIKAILIN